MTAPTKVHCNFKGCRRGITTMNRSGYCKAHDPIFLGRLKAKADQAGKSHD